MPERTNDYASTRNAPEMLPVARMPAGPASAGLVRVLVTTKRTFEVPTVAKGGKASDTN